MNQTHDPRPLFAVAAETCRNVIAGVRPEQHAAPTPCDGFDVATLIAHIHIILPKLATVMQGGPADERTVVEGLRLEEWVTTWDTDRATLNGVLEDDAVLGRMLDFGFAQMPGAAAIALYAGELTVHTWDLAVATGQHVEWNQAVLETALAMYQQMLPPGSPRGGYVPFAAAVEVPDDAPLIDRIVAFSGRTPTSFTIA
jgi:uncharacterized protein (TIGR03086 family)